MSRDLTKRELEHAFRELPSLYAETDFESLTKKALEFASRFIPNDGASYTTYANGQVGYRLLNVQLPHASRLEELQHWINTNGERQPLIVFAMTHPEVVSVRPSDVLSMRRFKETSIYREFLSAFEYNTQMGAICEAQQPMSGVFLHRQVGEFSTRDRDMLDQLLPHIQQALRNAQRFTTLTQNWESLSRALADRREALVILNRNSQICGSAGPVFDLFGRYFDARDRRGDGMPGAVLRWLQRRLSKAGSSAPPTDHGPLEVPGQTGHLTVWLQMDGPESFRLVLQERLLPSAPEGPRFEGLTRRENEILYWIGLGRANADIAQLLGVSARTINKHIQNLFTKIGAATRAEAVVTARQTFRMD